MSQPNPTRLVISAPRATIERLACEALLLRRSAAAFAFETSDGPPVGKSLVKYAAEAVAYRVVAEALAWPVTPAAFIEGAQKIGVERASAQEIAGQLHGERSLCHEPEMMGDNTAADWLLSRLCASPYLAVKGIRLTDTPGAPEPVTPPAPPAREENPVSADGWDNPSRGTLRTAAVAAEEV